MQEDKLHQDAGDRALLIYRIQSTVFVFFYGALIFCAIVWFKVRYKYIRDILGPNRSNPHILDVAVLLHHPVIIAIACILPIFLLIVIWATRPRLWFVLIEVILVAFVVTVAIVPPVASEITTAGLFMHVRDKAIEAGWIKATPVEAPPTSEVDSEEPE
jgi:hypothetical protein